MTPSVNETPGKFLGCLPRKVSVYRAVLICAFVVQLIACVLPAVLFPDVLQIVSGALAVLCVLFAIGGFYMIYLDVRKVSNANVALLIFMEQIIFTAVLGFATVFSMILLIERPYEYSPTGYGILFGIYFLFAIINSVGCVALYDYFIYHRTSERALYPRPPPPVTSSALDTQPPSVPSLPQSGEGRNTIATQTVVTRDAGTNTAPEPPQIPTQPAHNDEYVQAEIEAEVDSQPPHSLYDIPPE